MWWCPDCFLLLSLNVFNALTLSVGHQKEHLACRHLRDEVLAWFFWDRGANDFHPSDVTATPSSLASLKSRLV